jgi:hypothetical protein
MRAFLLLFAGCSSYAADATSTVLREAERAALHEPDVELARAALPAGIVQLDAFAHAYPAHREFAAMHAESECRFAVAFVFDDWEAASFTGHAGDASAIADRLQPLLERCIADSARVIGWDRRGVPSIDRATAPAAISIAEAMSIEVAVAPFAHLGELPSIEAIAKRCADVAPGTRDAGAEQLLGTLAAAKAQLLGGDDGENAFARARALAPHALMIDVMLARGVAVARGDRAMFEAALHRVLDVDASRWPEQRLANELARVKARRYLAAESQLFAR